MIYHYLPKCHIVYFASYDALRVLSVASVQLPATGLYHDQHGRGQSHFCRWKCESMYMH